MEEINIKDFLSYLKHYIFGFIAMIIVAVSAVLVYDTMLKKPIYKAQTTIVIAKSDEVEQSAVSLNDINASQKLAATYSEIAKSELVLKQVVDNLGLQYNTKTLSKNITIKPVENTSIISVAVNDQNARFAALIANEIATVFSKEITKIFKIDNVSQLSVAETPSAPSNNTLMRDVVLAVVVAILLVAGFAFVRFYLDDTVKHRDDIEKIFGLPVAGNISKSDIKTKNSELVVAKYPKSIVSENIKSLRTNLQFTAVDKNLKTILVTSSNASEGKSFVSTNLAISFAQADKKVLLIDCDLRKGRLHRLFKLFNNAGLSNLIAGDLKNAGSYIRHTGINKLDIITCGTYPPNPSELLASQKNKRLLTHFSKYYDIIILDGAPLVGLADSVILSTFVDETVIVVKDGNTSRADLTSARDSLKKVDANIAGIVFNMVNHKSSKYYYYYAEPEKK